MLLDLGISVCVMLAGALVYLPIGGLTLFALRVLRLVPLQKSLLSEGLTQ